MGQAAIVNERDAPGSRQPSASSSFEKLQELTRHGYLPDPHPIANGDGILLRHRSAPDLILWADGTLDVPVGQLAKTAVPSVPKAKKTRRWGRALLLFSLLVAFTFLSFLMMIAITE